MKPIPLDPESEARHSLARIRQFWRLRPWHPDGYGLRDAIRYHISVVRRAYPKHPPCDPAPYRFVGEPSEDSGVLAIQRVMAQAEASRRFRARQWHREVWEGRFPQMRWTGTSWEEVG